MQLLFLIFSLLFVNCLQASRYGSPHLHPRSHDPFIVIAIPKCGTHLLTNTITQLLRIHCDEGWDNLNPDDQSHLDGYYEALLGLKNESFIHKTVLPYTPKLQSVLEKANFRWLFLLRDPRDAIVSLLFYMERMSSDKRDFMTIESDNYDRLNLDEKLTALISGQYCSNFLLEIYKPSIGWCDQPPGLTVRFEDLIAVDDKQRQLDTLTQIVAYVGVTMSANEIKEAAPRCYCPESPQYVDGAMYQRGQANSWKFFFTYEHKELFKQIFGAELIQLGYEQDYAW
ncbi:MAG: sulfotransferase domain-containing protein [Chlamydiales bacterium]|nr:sulfotransferase domain-containing protein [Chlamydiales bacterium]